MKSNKKILVLAMAILTCVLLSSCSRSSMRNAGNAMKNTARRAENFVENGIDTVTGQGTYGANSSYSANVGMGTGTLPYSGNAKPLLPTLGDKSRDNKGQINTNNGSLDGGMGDIYVDSNRARNSLRRDKLS